MIDAQVKALGGSGGFYRHRILIFLGSTTEQSYTASDCTGEALKSVMYLQFNLE